jgi:hypothetical protein
MNQLFKKPMAVLLAEVQALAMSLKEHSAGA